MRYNLSEKYIIKNILNMEENIRQALQILDNFVLKQTEKYLDNREKAIISGALAGLFYSQMKQEKSALQGITVDYISQYVAYHLWKKLNKIWTNSEFHHHKIDIKKNTIWQVVEIISDRQINNNHDNLSPKIPPEELLGQILRNRFEIVEFLFERAANERHYLAYDRDYGDRSCSLIQLDEQSKTINDKLERQVRILSKLNKHPQIPALLAYFKAERYYYLVYEYVEGKPITNSLNASKIWSETKVRNFLTNTLSILEFIHQHNIVHRNLNPDNLIEQPDGKIIAIDFATVKEINHQGNSSLSQNSFAQGMKGYIPAEQLMGMITPSSDIYAVGKIAIHAFTGIHPLQLKINRQTGNIFWKNKALVSSELGEIIERMVQYHFPQRYQSATEILQDLNKN